MNKGLYRPGSTCTVARGVIGGIRWWGVLVWYCGVLLSAQYNTKLPAASRKSSALSSHVAAGTREAKV